jgi:hypothetical protein
MKLFKGFVLSPEQWKYRSAYNKNLEGKEIIPLATIDGV